MIDRLPVVGPAVVLTTVKRDRVRLWVVIRYAPYAIWLLAVKVISLSGVKQFVVRLLRSSPLFCWGEHVAFGVV